MVFSYSRWKFRLDTHAYTCVIQPHLKVTRHHASLPRYGSIYFSLTRLPVWVLHKPASKILYLYPFPRIELRRASLLCPCVSYRNKKTNRCIVDSFQSPSQVLPLIKTMDDLCDVSRNFVFILYKLIKRSKQQCGYLVYEYFRNRAWLWLLQLCDGFDSRGSTCFGFPGSALLFRFFGFLWCEI